MKNSNKRMRELYQKKEEGYEHEWDEEDLDGEMNGHDKDADELINENN